MAGIGAIAAPMQAITASMPGMDTSITIPGATAPPLTRIPRAGIGPDISS